MKTKLIIPALLFLVMAMALMPSMFAQNRDLQLCHDNLTDVENVVITACLDKSTYNVGDDITVVGFLRANQRVLTELPPTVNMAYYFDRPNLHNKDYVRFTVDNPGYNFVFTVNPDEQGNWTLTIITDEVGHNAVQFNIVVQQQFMTVTSQVTTVETSQVTSTTVVTFETSTTSEVVSSTENTITSDTVVVLPVPETNNYVGLLIVALAAVGASLFIMKRRS